MSQKMHKSLRLFLPFLAHTISLRDRDLYSNQSPESSLQKDLQLKSMYNLLEQTNALSVPPLKNNM